MKSKIKEKEIKLSAKEKKVLRELNEEIKEVMAKLGTIMIEFHLKKQQLIKRFTELQKRVNSEIDYLKKKYNIKEIKDLDINKGKIIIKE